MTHPEQRGQERLGLDPSGVAKHQPLAGASTEMGGRYAPLLGRDGELVGYAVYKSVDAPGGGKKMVLASFLSKDMHPKGVAMEARRIDGAGLGREKRSALAQLLQPERYRVLV